MLIKLIKLEVTPYFHRGNIFSKGYTDFVCILNWKNCRQYQIIFKVYALPLVSVRINAWFWLVVLTYLNLLGFAIVLCHIFSTEIHWQNLVSPFSWQNWSNFFSNNVVELGCTCMQFSYIAFISIEQRTLRLGRFSFLRFSQNVQKVSY